MDITAIPTLLIVAWLAPLVGFVVEIFAAYWQKDRKSKTAAYCAVGCIALGFVCSVAAFSIQRANIDDLTVHAEHHDEHHEKGEEGHGEHHEASKTKPISGVIYTLAQFGDLNITIDYYVDTLTLVMFMMVTLIATCIHVFAIGYMSDELTDDHVDHEVHLSDGKHLHRPGRFYRFFAYLSLFSFSMLGLVLAGNIFQVFIFWELVGICSYLLIGFYVERKSASTAANKAFIMNRVGDFGFLIGLMVLFTSFGTFSFGDWESVPDKEGKIHTQAGLFDMTRGEEGDLDVEQTKEGETVVHLQERHDHGDHVHYHRSGKTIPYWLLVVAGLGIFAGCIGKSAQFPLQTWLPDAMEGPTPVSALVHSATMVAAGVYLAGRFFPVFTPEVLLVIAYVGCITLFVAATIAIVATDIKRVLAYSTISQLGYMMLAIGVAGWAAGLFHLITHAFFKSLMFLCSGSVIVGCHHEQEMTRMGGLLKKMPITAITMLIGVIAISGLALPGVSFSALGILAIAAAIILAAVGVYLGKRTALIPAIGMLIVGLIFVLTTLAGDTVAFSGFHSKDAIVATALAYSNMNPVHSLLFWVPMITAGITAFYMFRLWFYTFLGKPRDQELHDHVHESPWVMTVPLLVLAVFAAFCAFGGEDGPLFQRLLENEPLGLHDGVAPVAVAGAEEGTTVGMALPSHDDVHEVHSTAGGIALLVAFAGTLIAYLLYGLQIVKPENIKNQFAAVHRFLVEKWQFDRLYDLMFVRPSHIVASWVTWIDRTIIDGFLHGTCRVTVDASRLDRKFDESVVDGLVNLVGNTVFRIGESVRNIQTGRLRQYVMFIAVGVLVMFMLLFTFFPQG